MTDHSPLTPADLDRLEADQRLREAGRGGAVDPSAFDRLVREVRRLRRVIAAAGAATADGLTTCPGCGTDVSAPGAGHDAGCAIAALEAEARRR